jgi:DNA-binding PadR family transcriptional regulator
MYDAKGGEDMDQREHVAGMVPLTPAVFHILLALSDGERHGYGIMQEIAARTHDQPRMGPGTLYGTIKRMLSAGLIDESGERPDPALDDQRRRYYRITPLGRNVAEAEAHRLALLVRDAHAKRLLHELQPDPTTGGA